MTGTHETTTVTVEVEVPPRIMARAEERAANSDTTKEEYLLDYVLLDPEFTTPDGD